MGRGACEDVDQIGAMRMQVGRAIALARFLRDRDGEDFLARAPDPHLQRFGRRGHGGDSLEHAKGCKRLGGVGGELQASADLEQGRGALDDFDFESDLAQRDGGAEPSDASACDDNLHRRAR